MLQIISFFRGKYKNLNTFCLVQSNAKILKHWGRDNVKFSCIFKQDNTNLKLTYDNFLGTDMSYEKFKICSNLTNMLKLGLWTHWYWYNIKSR